jgi:hypothetical protein
VVFKDASDICYSYSHFLYSSQSWHLGSKAGHWVREKA